MEFRDSPSEAAFRQEVRAFLASKLPSAFDRRPREWGIFNRTGGLMAPASEAMTRWRATLNGRGWGAPAWPREHGGGGLSVTDQFILNEEFAWKGAPRGDAGSGIGHGWAGPTIMFYGTDAQKQEYLPKIISGEHQWCQLFSEPGAGSDLASLQARAVRSGDDYVLSGQKIWSSGAHRADMGILLARTDADVPKHKGISYFLLDMKTVGITVRPLVNMLNSHEFNEVYFDDVRMPASQLLGQENRGWYQATTTLDLERSGIATSVSHQLLAEELVHFGKHASNGESQLGSNPSLRFELADRVTEAHVERLISYRIISMQARGELPSRESSIAKLYSSELDVRLAATAMHITGLYGQLDNRQDPRGMGGRVARFYMHSTTSPIGGGTSEIQRNVIATRGLGLPRV